MDLREFRPSPEQVNEAATLLHYQPFVLDDDRHTGVAYSWLYSEDPTRSRYSEFLFDRRALPEEVWRKAWDANGRLAAMYDAFAEVIVDTCGQGSMLDIGCNTGYLPVKASLAGVRNSAGMDHVDWSRAFHLLNQITGSRAQFLLGHYDPSVSSVLLASGASLQQYDVVSSTAVLCHMPDPLHFLRAISRIASKAVFLWSGFMETDELLIRYSGSNKFRTGEFPHAFDDGTSISLGLLFHSMSALGLHRHEEIRHRPEWLAEDWHKARIPQYQQFRAFMFYR
jgi:SAM-dependent methyltransferase